MMSSSTTRNTPNLTVPLTQTTAPVIKFQCLYTHDVRRKAKRWQDGYLRFHTFNRRVMVYDSSGNFIGDLHWRESEDIQDGDEMELDKGVLIQVGECMERTEADLTAMLERRRPDQASSPRKEPTPRLSHAARPHISAPSQPRETSLSALLGIKRTPIEHMVAPAAASYKVNDQVTHVHTSNVEERPLKRMRESRENTTVQRKNSVERPQLQQQLGKANVSESVRRENSPSKQSRPLNPPQGVRAEPANSTNPVCRPALSASRSIPNREAAPPPSLSRHSLPPPNSGSKTGVRSTDSQGSQPNTLRISTQKPRKKLMYQALLPQNGSQKRQRPSSELDAPVGLHNAQMEQQRSYLTGVGDLSDLIAEFSSDDFPDSLINPSTRIDEIKQSPSPSTLVALTNIPAEGSLAPRIKASPSSINPQIPAVPRESQQQFLKPEMSTNPRGLFEPGARNLRVVPQINPNQPRQLLRSHSEADTLNPRAPPPLPKAPPVPPPRLQPIDSNPRRVNPPNANLSPRKIFQKSISDLSALNPQSGNQSHAIIATGKRHVTPVLEAEDDQGPWTSEALDLFDWWPPGRPKPMPKGDTPGLSR